MGESKIKGRLMLQDWKWEQMFLWSLF